MLFLDGTRDLSCSPQRWRTHIEYGFDEEAGAYQLGRSLSFETTVDSTGGLVVNGGKYLGRLPLIVSVRPGGQEEYGDTTERQTKWPSEDFPRRTLIPRAIGDCHYWPAGNSGPEQMFVNLYIEVPVFEDIWSAARTPGVRFLSMSFSLFGNNLTVKDEVSGFGYYWNADDRNGGGGLLVAAFYYATENAAGQP
jgi:hypothetical protein